MKRIIALILVLVLSACLLCGCGGNTPQTTAAPKTTAAPGTTAAPETTKAAENVELFVLAAASMQETLTELKAVYEKDHPGVKITYTFDSSGTLKKQIQEGAACDIFISAGQKQMNQLDKSADPAVNTDGLDFVAEGTRFNILENKVALAVPENNPKNINSYEDMKAALEGHASSDKDVVLAMGDADVPVGQYTQKILAFYGLDEAALAANGAITYGSNVKDVTSKVKEAAVDCGIIYQTDAFSAGLKIVDTATKEMCGQVIYPAAVMKPSKNPEAAQAFLDFLKSKDAGAVFEKVGFTPLN